MPTPEDKAREQIDKALEKAGWYVQDYKHANVNAGRGIALRNFPLVSGYGFADYLLYIDGKAAGVIEAKKEGVTLTGVEVQAEKYSKGLPAELPAQIRPLPFLYQSTGVETRFTNGLDPEPRSRRVFAFHRPDTLASCGRWRKTTPSRPKGSGPRRSPPLRILSSRWRRIVPAPSFKWPPAAARPSLPSTSSIASSSLRGPSACSSSSIAAIWATRR